MKKNQSTQYELFTDFLPEEKSPLEGKSVCIMGTFCMGAKALQKRLRDLGADYKPGLRVSRNTHYIILGENVSAEQMDVLQNLAFNGYHPRVLREHDLEAMSAGHYAEYRVNDTIRKDLHLTLQHYTQFRLDLNTEQNPLYTKELFVAPDISTPQEELYRKLGERGVYANPYIDDSTDVFLLSENTISNLRNGQTDDVIRLIENTYNTSRSQTFHYVMTSEQDVCEWLAR